MNIKNIGVIGCGRWGTFIAWYLDKIGHSVSLYGRENSKKMQELLKNRKNDYIPLSDTLKLTTDLKEVIKNDIIVISVGVQSLGGLCEQLKEAGIKNKYIVLCMKGLEISTGRRPSQIVCDALDPSNTTAVWIGPGHVQDYCAKIPNCMVIDSENELVKEELIEAFSSNLIRFYYGNDLIGNEIGAATKNVVGIAAGMLDGLSLTSLKGALMTRGTREISKFIEAMGGKSISAYGLCHLGDYCATLFSEYSHNRMFGEKFVKKEEFDALAEGYYTVKSVHQTAINIGIEMPICNAVYNILYEGKDPKDELNVLMQRSLKEEFY